MLRACLDYCLAVMFWIVTIAITIAHVSLLRIIALLRLGGKDPTYLFHRVATSWGRSIVRAFPLWKIRVLGTENLPRPGERPVVLVSNHQSMTDIFLMYFLDVQFRWLSKAEVFKIPGVGWAMRGCGYVAVQRGNRDSHGDALIQSGERLKAGVSMLFFPEGTRSPDGSLGAFKLGAFRLAADQGLQVQPLVLSGAHELIRKGSWIPKASSVTLQVLPRTQIEPGESVDAFAERVRRLIASAIASTEREQGYRSMCKTDLPIRHQRSQSPEANAT